MAFIARFHVTLEDYRSDNDFLQLQFKTTMTEGFDTHSTTAAWQWCKIKFKDWREAQTHQTSRVVGRVMMHVEHDYQSSIKTQRRLSHNLWNICQVRARALAPALGSRFAYHNQISRNALLCLLYDDDNWSFGHRNEHCCYTFLQLGNPILFYSRR